MSTHKTTDDNIHDINIVPLKLNFFHNDAGQIQVLEYENQNRLPTTEHFNSSTLIIKDHQQQIEEMNAPNQSQFDYYEEYRKIYLISYHLYLQKIKHVEIRLNAEKRIKIVQDKIKDLEKQQAPNKDTEEENRIKRARRTADQIQRRFKCQVQFCQRFYGSEGSLQQHIKLKHPQLYKKNNQNISIQESFLIQKQNK